ncbi:MAG: SH3 domain-containing protein [Cyanobacteria bacterium P01_A01_bin.114]
MSIKKACLSLVVLGSVACSPSSTTTEPALPLAVEKSTAPISSQPTDSAQPTGSAQPTEPSISPKQVGWDPADNDPEKCFVMLAYDPEDTSVNLRDQPDGNILTSLPNLTPLNTEGPAGIEPGWNYVYAVDQDRWGYIWQDLIRLTYYQVEDPQDTYANLRQTPNGPVIDTLANGTEVRFMGTDGTWTQVELASGQVGYVATSLLMPPNCF